MKNYKIYVFFHTMQNLCHNSSLNEEKERSNLFTLIKLIERG